MNEKPFRLAVRAVIRDEAGRCLLLLRSPANKGFVGYWEWPGGKVDPGEEFEHALHREARPTGGTLRLSAEHDAFEWVPLEELANRRLLDVLKPVLKNLLERKELP